VDGIAVLGQKNRENGLERKYHTEKKKTVFELIEQASIPITPLTVTLYPS
jgi:hypothetical protein